MKWAPVCIGNYRCLLTLRRTLSCQGLNADETTKSIFQHLGRFGAPEGILTDRGTAFYKEFVSELIHMSGSRHELTISHSKEENAADPESSAWPDLSLGVACTAIPFSLKDLVEVVVSAFTSDPGRPEASDSLDLVKVVTSDLGFFGCWACELFLLVLWRLVADSSVPSCSSGVSSNRMISLRCMFLIHSCLSFLKNVDRCLIRLVQKCTVNSA